MQHACMPAVLGRASVLTIINEAYHFGTRDTESLSILNSH